MHIYTAQPAPRAAPRAKVFQVASLIVGGADHRVHMLDVSAVGARIHCAEGLAVGAQVMLGWAGEVHPARVAWSRGSMAGLRFVIPLSAEQMERLFEAA